MVTPARWAASTGLRVAGGRLRLDQVGDGGSAQQVMKLLRPRRRRRRQQEAAALHDLQEITGTPAGTQARQVLLREDDLLTHADATGHRRVGLDPQGRQEVVRAHPDERTHPFEGDIEVLGRKRLHECESVRVIAVEQRSVDVEQGAADGHSAVPARGVPSLALVTSGTRGIPCRSSRRAGGRACPRGSFRCR